MGNFRTLIIIGMHRSGTSLTASLLQKSGLDIGKKLMGAGTGNPEGHYENVDFFDFHVNALQELNYHPDGWDAIEIEQAEQYEDEAKKIIEDNQSSLWGWKEPRTTLFLNFWEKLLPEANFLFVYRSPVEVVDSLFRRGSDDTIMNDPEKSVDIWAHYNKLVMKNYKKFKDRSFLVNINSLILNYPAFINAINKKFNIQLNPHIESLYNKELFKEYSENGALTEKLLYLNNPEILDIWKELNDHSWNPPTEKNYYDGLNLTNNNSSLYKEYFFKQWKNSCMQEGELNRLINVTIPLIRHERDLEFSKKSDIIFEKEQLIQEREKVILSLQQEIDWMKNSKFWTMRRAWQKLKSASVNIYSYFI